MPIAPPTEEIDWCRARERIERAASAAAGDDASRDVHFMRAERLADRIWSLEEQVADAARPAAR